jgi:hypothetical protein
MRSEVSTALMLRILAILVATLSSRLLIPDGLMNIPPSTSRAKESTLTLVDI